MLLVLFLTTNIVNKYCFQCGRKVRWKVTDKYCFVFINKYCLLLFTKYCFQCGWRVRWDVPDKYCFVFINKYCLLLFNKYCFQCGRKVRWDVPDKYCRLKRRVHALCPTWDIQIHMQGCIIDCLFFGKYFFKIIFSFWGLKSKLFNQGRHHLVSIWRSGLRP